MAKQRSCLFAVCLVVVLVCYGCGDDSTAPPPPMTDEELVAYFQHMLNTAVASDPSIHNAVMMVDAPLRDFRWKGAAGWADPVARDTMLPDDQFRTASIGKMTCATLAMMLVEEGRFALEDSVHRYLPASIMNGLHVLGANDYGNDITIRHLLSHRSGLADYVTDGDENHDEMPDFLEILIAEPDRFWTPEETIEYTKQHLEPFFAPGEGFHYSDANYQLLGLVCQEVMGKLLHEIYREMLFGPLGMDHTYVEFYDTPRPSIPDRGLSHVFFQDIDYTDWKSASADWAGGGLVSTAEDLSVFLRAFADGGIFTNPQSKTEMLSWGPAISRGVYYGLGVTRINLDEHGMPGMGDFYGHDGFPQSFMYYWPKQQVTIVGTLNQALSDRVFWAQMVVGVIDALD